jgi:hypothetical protein
LGLDILPKTVAFTHSISARLAAPDFDSWIILGSSSEAELPLDLFTQPEFRRERQVLENSTFNCCIQERSIEAVHKDLQFMLNRAHGCSTAYANCEMRFPHLEQYGNLNIVF